jgi:probable O-glycosylation ligase (exosortase A-associated)
MKQTALMLVLLLVGTAGPILYGPFLGVAIYYLFAVLRPQSLWRWALLVDLRWSYYVAVATILSTVIHVSNTSTGKRFGSTHAALFAFAIWMTLSHLFALNAEVSSQWYPEYFKIFLMFFCGSLIISSLDQVRILYLIAVGAVGYIAYEVNFLYLTAGRLDIYRMGYGGLDNNGAGLMIAMGIPMAYFLWQGYRRWWRWIFLATLLLMIHAVLMTYSRGAMLALLVTSPLLILRGRRKQQTLCFTMLVLFAVPILAGKEIRARFFSIEQYEEDGSAQSRFGSWNAAWNIAKDYPLFGVGLRNADLLSESYGADSQGRTIHSQYLQILADSGFPALGLYLLVFLGAWRNVRRAQKHFRHSELESDLILYSLACGIEGTLVVFVVGSSFLSLEVFELPYLIILLALKFSLAVTYEAVSPVTSVPTLPQLASSV